MTTDADIEALRIEALRHGDLAMAGICALALCGNPRRRLVLHESYSRRCRVVYGYISARAECERVIMESRDPGEWRMG